MGLPTPKLLHEFLKNIWMSWKLLRPLSIKSCGCCRGIRTQWQRGLQGKRGWCLQEFFPQPWALTDSVLRNLTRIRSATLWDTLYPISLALLHEPTLLSSVLSLCPLSDTLYTEEGPSEACVFFFSLSRWVVLIKYQYPALGLIHTVPAFLTLSMLFGHLGVQSKDLSSPAVYKTMIWLIR